ncbi:protein of unknown function DUF1713, mitochondria [Nannochloropsis gaditana]|uniref:Ribosomal protein mS38 C-terminal domain-containing protein n=1 Tax=Nannochloropsis gaditana TaxID=72520 RepID=W7TK42_9STRA|nr:protein of unknown function DUF1713, mitochondria [Nannochloropsis gaditana]
MDVCPSTGPRLSFHYLVLLSSTRLLGCKAMATTAALRTWWSRLATPTSSMSMSLTSQSSIRALYSSPRMSPTSVASKSSIVGGSWQASSLFSTLPAYTKTIRSLPPSPGQPSSWFGHILSGLLKRCSSTLKKRRSKMNKHKLKKRRKLMRNKNKKNL